MSDHDRGSLDDDLRDFLRDKKKETDDGFTLRALHETVKHLATALAAVEARHVRSELAFVAHEKSNIVDIARIDNWLTDLERRLKMLEKDVPELERDVSQSGEHRVTVERLEAAFVQMQAEDKARTEATIAEAKVVAAAKLAEKELELQKVAAELKALVDEKKESSRHWFRWAVPVLVTTLLGVFGYLLASYLARATNTPPAPPALIVPAPH